MDREHQYRPCPDIKARHVAMARELLFNKGATQQQVAQALGYSAKTINEWVKSNGWRDALQKLDRKRKIPRKSLSDSLSIFMMYLKKKEPDLYKLLEPEQRKFIRTL